MAREYTYQKASFGDGSFALFGDMKDLGDGRWEVKVKPDYDTMVAQGLTENDFDPMTYCLTRIYRKEDCKLLRPQPPSWLILCDFNGKPSDFVNNIARDLLQQVDYWRKQYHISHRLLISQQFEQNRLFSHHADFFGRQVRLMKDIAEATAEKRIIQEPMGGTQIEMSPRR